MSVLRSQRSESKAEFINTAYKICTQTLSFLTRLSARYSRLLASNTANLASEVLDNAEKANSIFPSDETRKKLREEYLLKSRAALMALDVKLSICVEVMLLNPEGCMEKANKKQVEGDDAVAKLEKFCQSLGELIDKENALLTGIIKSEKE